MGAEPGRSRQRARATESKCDAIPNVRVIRSARLASTRDRPDAWCQRRSNLPRQVPRRCSAEEGSAATPVSTWATQMRLANPKSEARNPKEIRDPNVEDLVISAKSNSGPHPGGASTGQRLHKA